MDQLTTATGAARKALTERERQECLLLLRFIQELNEAEENPVLEALEEALSEYVEECERSGAPGASPHRQSSSGRAFLPPFR